MQTRWEIMEYDKAAAEELMQALSISELLAKLLVLRGITDPEEARNFLYQDDLSEISPPESLSGMTVLVERVKRAVTEGERIMVYGDYDVDGICSVVILMECLQYLGARVEYRIPDRFSEGYGLNSQAVEEIAAQGYRLIVTVDCGITSIEEAETCLKTGIDLIITDHHNPGVEIPRAYAVINPKLDEIENSRNLAGVGVAFKTALALTDGNPPGLLLQEWVILAALATVADVVPLKAENRVIVKKGLQLMAQTRRPGLRRLLQAEGLLEQRITTEKLAFQIIPKLNSAGRLETAAISIDTLLTKNQERADELVEYLLKLNEQRREIEDEMLQEAIRVIEEQPEILAKPLLIVQGQDWNHGIIGILASRLVSKYHKPTLVMSWSNGMGKGSGRCVEGISLYDILAAGRAYLLRFGGHKMAAGLTVEAEHFPAFYEAAMEKAEEIMRQMPEVHVYHLDAQVTTQQLFEESANILEHLEPLGEGNPQPLFLVRGVEVDFHKRIGKKQEHVLCRTGKLEGIAFQLADQVKKEQTVCRQDIVFAVSEHEYMGVRRLQMVIQEFCPTADYAGKCDLPEAPYIENLRAITGRLIQNRPVLLVYDDTRALQKHRTSLQFYFRSAFFYILHGEMMPRERRIAEDALARGEGRIFLFTRSALLQWLENNRLPENLDCIYLCWNRPREDGPLPLPPRVQVERWEKEEPPGEASGQRGIVYVNRGSTSQRMQQKYPQHLSELQKIMEERCILRWRWRQEEKPLFTDGVPVENSGEGQSGPKWIELADVPYTLAEIYSWLKPGLTLSVSFTEEDEQNARQLLERKYPTREILFAAVKKIIIQNLEINKLYSIPQDIFLKLCGQQTGESVTLMELEGVLRIFSDLGLCEYRKKGTILAIKLLSHANAGNKEHSLYYCEGRESKASLAYCLQCLRACREREVLRNTE